MEKEGVMIGWRGMKRRETRRRKGKDEEEEGVRIGDRGIKRRKKSRRKG